MSNGDRGAAEIRGIFAGGDLWWPILDVLRPGRYAGAISRRQGMLPLRCVGGNGTTDAVTEKPAASYGAFAPVVRRACRSFSQ
jgi:hypothetical protein